MSRPKQRGPVLVFGVDPGMTRTGLVASRILLDDGTQEILASATFHSDPSLLEEVASRPTHQRVQDLSEEIYAWCSKIRKDYAQAHDPFVAVKVAIERPIYNKNALAFEKQWRLFQAILHHLTLMCDGVSEVSNGSAKVALVGEGKASKETMVAHTSVPLGEFTTAADREAVADAEGICRAYDRGTYVYDTRWDEPAACVGPFKEWRK